MRHTHYQAIYLSPHLDDAALSCGGQIAQRTTRGEHVLIVSVMAGDPAIPQFSDYIESLHTRWGLAADAAAQRRQEDLAACQILGAETLHLSVPDCIYRYHPQTGEPMYISDADIFGEIHEGEAGLVESLRTELAALPPCDALYLPLTVGHHVDHQLVRRAAEQLTIHPVCYYEDYPYAQKSNAVERLIAPERERWASETYPLSEIALQTKMDAIWAYRSQLSTFFQNRADFEGQIRTFAEQRGGEKIWQRVDNRDK